MTNTQSRFYGASIRAYTTQACKGSATPPDDLGQMTGDSKRENESEQPSNRGGAVFQPLNDQVSWTP